MLFAEFALELNEWLKRTKRGVASVAVGHSHVETDSQRRILEFWKLQQKEKSRLLQDVRTLFAAIVDGMQAFPTPADADYSVLFKV